jgi:hypothetical protein
MWKIVLYVVLGLVALALGAICWMIGPRNVFGMLLYDQRREGTLKVGDVAPDVTLVGLDGVSEARLAGHFGEQPLVLIFGSFT